MSGRIPLTNKKSTVKKEPLKITEHNDLDTDEKKALYKFFKNHPEDVLGIEKRKCKRKNKKIKRSKK